VSDILSLQRILLSLLSTEPCSFNLESLGCVVTKILYAKPLNEICDWDDRVKVIRWVDAEPAADRYDRVKVIRWVDAEPAADRYDRVKVIRWVIVSKLSDG